MKKILVTCVLATMALVSVSASEAKAHDDGPKHYLTVGAVGGFKTGGPKLDFGWAFLRTQPVKLGLNLTAGPEHHAAGWFHRQGALLEMSLPFNDKGHGRFGLAVGGGYDLPLGEKLEGGPVVLSRMLVETCNDSGFILGLNLRNTFTTLHIQSADENWSFDPQLGFHLGGQWK